MFWILIHLHALKIKISEQQTLQCTPLLLLVSHCHTFIPLIIIWLSSIWLDSHRLLLAYHFATSSTHTSQHRKIDSPSHCVHLLPRRHGGIEIQSENTETERIEKTLFHLKSVYGYLLFMEFIPSTFHPGPDVFLQWVLPYPTPLPHITDTMLMFSFFAFDHRSISLSLIRFSVSASRFRCRLSATTGASRCSCGPDGTSSFRIFSSVPDTKPAAKIPAKATPVDHCR